MNLSWLFGRRNGLGALDDNRPAEAKRKDYFFREIVATADPVNWVEKSPSQWRSFTLRNQDGSGSCVKQSKAKEAEVLYFVRTGESAVFSAGFYKYRKNAPQSGMIGVDAYEIWRTRGIPLEAMLGSQNMSDAQLDAVDDTAIDRDVASVFKIDNYVQFVPGQDFETIASTIQKTGKGVNVWFKFEYAEWNDMPWIKVSNPTLHHSVVAVDFTLYKGKKYLVIEDSWGDFNQWKGRRLISEEFFASRNTFAAYALSFKFLEEQKPERPRHRFTKNLRFGETSDDVRFLQEILKFEGLMATSIASTGYYGAITAKSLMAFQRKYKIASEAEIASLKGEVVGPKTLECLNQLYGG